MRNFKYIVVLCFLLLSQWIAAGTVLQSEDKNWIGKVPKFHRTEGNDFWLAFMNIGAFDPDQPTEEGEEGEGGEGGEGDEDIKQTLKLNVVVTARERMTIIVRAGTYSSSFPVNANQTYVFSLPTQYTYYLNQYYLSQSEEEPIGDQKRKQGVHVYAAENDKDKVFSCYLYARLGNSGNTLRDASLVYPTKFLGKEYMIQTYPEDIAATEFAIVATEDDTRVRIKPSVTTAGGHSSSFSVKLKKGEAYLVASQSVELGATDVDLSGTTITANNPIAVFSGNQKAIIPYQEGYTEDFMVEQSMPVSQWGKEFYLSLMEQTRENHALITAMENNTRLEMTSYNTETGQTNTIYKNLRAGETTENIQLHSDLYTEWYIKSDKPVLCNSFMTSAAANLFTTYNPTSGKTDSLYGDPASAMVPAWELRTDTMTLFRTDLDPLNPNKTPQYLFAYVVVKKDDIYKMRVKMPYSEWIIVDASLFKTFKVNSDMAYAHIPLYKGTMTDAPEAYTLAMNGGEGFVGTAYAITIGQSYDYTLGFQPHEYPDSLYVTDIDGGQMSPKSYDMEPLDNKGWYQRQLTEWKRARLDTAYVCDTATVCFAVDANPNDPHQRQKVTWYIYPMDKGKDEADPVYTSEGGKVATRDTMKYQFHLPDDEDRDDVRPYVDYKIKAAIQRKPYMSGSNADCAVDTLKSIVRVHRIYNDTAYRVVCVGDTLPFFKDSLYDASDPTKYEEGQVNPTKFVGAKKGQEDKYLDKWVYQLEAGKYDTITRRYAMPTGCDSVMTLVIFVCDTFQIHDTLHLCSNQDSLYRDTILFKGKDYTGERTYKKIETLTDAETDFEIVLKAGHCDCQLIDDKAKFLDKNENPFAGCDSTYFLHVVQHDYKITPIEATYCLDKDGKGTYQWELTDHTGTKTIDISEDNENLSWDENLKAFIGTFRDTLRTNCPECNEGAGCDSIVELKLTMAPSYIFPVEEVEWCQLHYNEETHEAEHQYYHWAGHPNGDPVGEEYTSSGTYKEELHSQHGCDSIYTLHLTYNAATELNSKLVDTTCYDPDLIYTEWKDVNGEVIQAIPLADYPVPAGKRDTTIYFGIDAGCDTVYVLHLTIMPKYNYQEEKTITQEQNYTWDINGVTYCGTKYPDKDPSWTVVTEDTVIYKLKPEDAHTVPIGTHSCDSNNVLKLYIASVYRDTVSAFVCSNEPNYEWWETRPQWYDERGVDFRRKTIEAADFPEEGETQIYEHAFETTQGYDSIFYLKLYCAPSYHKDTTHVEFCQARDDSEKFIWIDDDGFNHTTKRPYERKNYDKPDGFTFDVAGEFFYRDTLETAEYGCDSLWVLHMIVHPYFDKTRSLTVCQDEVFTWPEQDEDSIMDATGTTRIYSVPTDVPGIYNYKVYLHTQHGCDSIYDLTLKVAKKYETPVHETVCDTEDKHTFTFTDTHGNKETVTIDYSPHPEVPEDEAPFTHYDTKIETHDVTLKSVDGCDSVIHFELTILPSYHFFASGTGCFGDPVEWRGSYISESNTYYDKMSTLAGCDSIFKLDFYITPYITVVLSAAVCDNEEFYHYDTIGETIFPTLIWRPGTPRREIIICSFKGKDGCDSIRYEYHMKYLQSYEVTADAGTICSGDSAAYWSEELQHDFRRFVIDYPVGPAVAPYDTIFRDTLKTVNTGCDSIFNLKAYILPSYRDITYDTICSNESYTWHRRGGQDSIVTKPAPGTLYLRDSVASPLNCDIIYEVQLFVKSSFFDEDSITLCSADKLEWHGQTIEHLVVQDEPYFYFDSLINENGCDSVFHLYVTAVDTTEAHNTEWMCTGDTLYVLPDVYYTESGYYIDTTTNAAGCDSIIYTDLTVIPPTVPTVWAEKPMCMDEQVIEFRYTYTSEKPIMYSLLFDEAGHALGFEDQDSIEITEYTDPMVIPVPVPYEDENDKRTYPRPDRYTVQLILYNDICYHPETDCFTDTIVELNYPSWVLEQRFNDMIAILSDQYNGGYTWTDYQWYHNNELLVGETKPYLYVPSGLSIGDEYHVRLTRTGESDDFATCPITVTYNPNGGGYTPTMGYLSVTPTCVVAGHPFINILSRKDGTYRVTNSAGNLVSEGVFRADVTTIELPGTNGLYIVQLWSPDTTEEPYRAIKVLVRDKCENCDTSF